MTAAAAPDPYVINDPRYRLRALTVTDADALAAFSQDERYWRYLSYGARTPEEVEAFVYHAVAESQVTTPREIWWAVEDPQNGAFIGTANYKPLVRGQGAACSVGCALAPAAQGRGLGPALGWALIVLAFEQYGADVVECSCAADNVRSLHTMRDTFVMTDCGDRVIERKSQAPSRERVFSLTRRQFAAARLDIEDRLANSAASAENKLPDDR